MLNFTATISSSSVCKDNSQVTIRITLNETFTFTTWFTRIPNGFALKRAWPSLAFGRPLAALELAMDFGSFSDKFHLFLCKQTADGTRFYIRYGIRVPVIHR